MQYGRGYSQGTERYVSILLRGLRACGHEGLVLGGDPEHRGPSLPLGAPVPGEADVLHYPSRGWMGVEGTAPDALLPLLRREKPDVVHLTNPGHIGIGILDASRRAGIGTVVTIMDYWWLCPKHTLVRFDRGICDAQVHWRDCVSCVANDQSGFVPRLLAGVPLLGTVLLPTAMFARSRFRGLPRREIGRWKRRQTILREGLNGASAVIFPSRAARGALAHRLDRPRLYSIPYGLEPQWFRDRRPAPDPACGVAPDRLTIGFAGALAPHKGAHLLLEAVRHLGWFTTRIRIAGGGDDPRYLRRLRRLADGLNVEFVGRVPPASMPVILRAVDVLVVPSLWPENLPIVVLEAQASGVPVLASRVEGIVEAISNPAHLFDVGSATGLADCLATWAASPTPTFGAKVFTAKQMTDATMQVYEECRRP